MTSTNRASAVYPPKFRFKRLKMALGYCGFCSSRSSQSMEMTSEDDQHRVITRTNYRLCTAHAHEFIDAARPVASNVKLGVTLGLNELLDL